jgi:non-ribosomal peptide synthetase component F
MLPTISIQHACTNRQTQEVPTEWNSTATAYPRDKCVHQLFEQRASETPDAPALICANDMLSYGELNGKANQLARYLRRAGCGPNVLVGICMHRSVEMIVSLLGILKAGAAYVPIDPSYPEKRIAAMLEDVDLKLLLTTQEGMATGLRDQRVETICLDSEWDVIGAEGTSNPSNCAGIDDLCYVIFTSGSTGKSKAAAVCHGGWTNLMHWFVTEFSIGSADKVLVASSFSFDITQRSIVMPLIRGGQLHLLASRSYDTALTLYTIANNNITLLNCAPSTFYPLVEGHGEEGFKKMQSLRVLFLGG